MSIRAGERRIVSVLVVDVAGSTAIAERLGPERSKFLFDEIVRLMREEVERFGGTVAQLTGDGIFALFGAPVAHEDDSERAVRAALAIRDAVGRYAQQVGPAYGIELTLRAAVNTGPVVVPDSDAAPDVLYNALGDTVNVAARLQAYGGLVVASETARQLGDRFALEPLGELDLRGRSVPTAAFHVGGERETPAEGLVGTPFVGRESELAVLEQVFGELVEGRGAVVVLTGESGIGKSRLKSEARSRFRERIRFLEGHAVSYGADTPYWPLRELLRDWLGLGVSDVEARVRLELHAGLAGLLGADAADAYPFLATLLGLPLEEELERRLRELSRDSVQQQTFDALYRLVLALSGERPLCLVFEDLHWADEATTALLDGLLAATEEAVAIILSFRPEGEHVALDLADRARRRFRHRFIELELSPLGGEAAGELAAASAQAALPDEVTEVLAERSGGNPFFLEEALRDLIERGVLRRQNGRFELTADAALIVPPLVQEALQARLDRLPQATRELVTTAAVVGRSFGLPLLERLVAASDLRHALSELQRLELIVEERRRPAPEYRFRHGLVQEVAYRRLVEPQRRALHLAVGEALEQLHRNSPEEVYGVLARHFSEADEAERAAEYLLKAADAARALDAEHEALELYQRALSFMERMGDARGARETLLKVALTQHLAFDFAGASATYRRAFAHTAPAPQRLEPTVTVSTSVLIGDQTFVPGHAHDELTWSVCRNLFRGLLAIGPEYEILPDLAQSMEIGLGGRQYRFLLRPDAAWSDGVPVTATDFEFTWTQMRKQQVAMAFLLDDVAEVIAQDELTLEVALREPRSYFLYLLAQPPFFPWPRHVCEEHGTSWHRVDPLVGSGPFMLLERNGDEIVLHASPTWQGPRGNIQHVRINYVTDLDDAAARWRAGEGDILEYFRSKASLDEAPATQALSPPQMTTFYLGLNANRPPFDDVRVRRAVAHAVDRPAILEHWDVRADTAGRGGLIPPALPAHTHRAAPPFDPDRARQLLADAGHPGGRGIPAVTVVVPAPYGGLRPLADQLAAIGITANLQQLPYAEMSHAAETAEAHVWGWNADYPDPAGMMTLFKWFPHLEQNEGVRQLLAAAGSLRKRADRLRLYRKADQLWVGERAALIPLAYGRDAIYTRPWLDGFWKNAVTSATFADLVVRTKEN